MFTYKLSNILGYWVSLFVAFWVISELLSWVYPKEFSSSFLQAFNLATLGSVIVYIASVVCYPFIKKMEREGSN